MRLQKIILFKNYKNRFNLEFLIIIYKTIVNQLYNKTNAQLISKLQIELK